MPSSIQLKLTTHLLVLSMRMLRLLTDSANQLELELDVSMPVIIVTTCLVGWVKGCWIN